MNVIEFMRTENLVRADSEETENGFRYFDEEDNTYSYFVPMDDNSHNLYIRMAIKEGRSIFITPNYVLVFNLKNNTAGIVKADKMVEPVNFTVNIIASE
ncbi:hypothetical protein LCGC14_1108780 [marine sediment metagenome]|uniref:Uncharacterized protein n=1 Tax=marine sediment metagenome TaxID=412755 RepID=A0A0F9PQK5_9ZZZZ